MHWSDGESRTWLSLITFSLILVGGFLFCTAPYVLGAFVDDPLTEKLERLSKAGDPLSGSNLVINSEFDTGLVGWTSTGDVTILSQEARLGDTATSNSHLYQGVSGTTATFTLEFDFANSLSTNVSPGTFLDTFFVSLYFIDDISGFSIESNNFDGSISLFDLDANGVFNNIGGTIGASPKGPEWQHFSYSFQGSNATIIPAFELAELNAVDGDSEVGIDNVMLTAAIPEPRIWFLTAVGGMSLCWYRRRMRRRMPC